MSKKTPKIKSDPIVSTKNPKIFEDPTRYKEYYPSWQIGRIDNKSRWGILSFRDKIVFRFTDELINNLSTISNELYDALNSLDGKTFDNLDDFIEKLQTKSKHKIDSPQLKLVIRSIEENIFWREIFPKLKNIETNSWTDIEQEMFGHGDRKTKHHYIAIERIIPEARKRLIELKLDDIEELFSIRLTGKIRIWGIRKFSYLQILWFDFEHEICPSSYN